MQTLLSVLITVQFLVVVAHDWVTIPGWTYSAQVQAVVGRRKLLLATLINAIFPGLAVAFALFFWSQPKPRFVANYWLIYCAITLISAILMWYVPYCMGTSKKTTQEYATMYAGTRHILPPRGDHPRPNLLHLCFHALFLVTFSLSLVLWSSAAV